MNKNDISKDLKESDAIIIYNPNPILNSLKPKSKIDKLIEIFENIVECIFNLVSTWVNIIGPCFTIAFYCFFTTVFLSFISNLIPFWLSEPRTFFSFIIIVIIFPLYILSFLYVVLNYTLATIIKPGSVKDIRKSIKFKTKINPYYSKLINLNYILKENNFDKSITNKFPFCKICNETKPLRTHHCNVCNECIMRMDHHCPWINNCVGLNNYKYFVLFLYHLWFLCVSNTIMSIYLFFFSDFNTDNQFTFVTILCLCGIFISTFFNIWYWIIIFNNDTSIEFWTRQIRRKILIKSFSLSNYKENLFITFCQRNLFKILYIPSIKSLDLSGLEWSRIIDRDFYIEGIHEYNDIFNDEEIKINK